MAPKINLLPPLVQEERLMRQRRRVITVLALTIVGLILGIYAGFVHLLESQKQELALLQQSIDDAGAVLSHADLLQKSKVEVERKKGILQHLYQRGLRWSRLLQDATDCLPGDVWLTEMSMNETKELILKGKASSYTSIGDFMLRLGQLSHFQTVLLSFAQDEKTEDVQIVKFELRCHLNEGRLP